MNPIELTRSIVEERMDVINPHVDNPLVRRLIQTQLQIAINEAITEALQDIACLLYTSPSPRD